MRNGSERQVWLTAAQCARSTGVTVKALRLYEQAGLIQPRRTEKNWRLYGANEMARLTEVLALKRLGLSLQHISRLMAGQTTDLDRLLAIQSIALRERQQRLQQSLAMIDTLRAKTAAGTLLSVDDLVNLAKETNMRDASMDSVAWRRYEQARPRTEKKIAADLYADYAGFYLLDQLVFRVTLRDGRLFARLTGQGELEIFAEDEDHFFYKAVQAQITFTRDDEGAVSSLILHQNGHEQAAKRIGTQAALAMEEALAERISNNQKVENGEFLLRQLIEQHRRGEPDYTRMMPALAVAAREQSAIIQAELKSKGKIRGISFKCVNPEGWDVYDVTFDNGKLECRFILASDGRFGGVFFGPIS